MAFNVMRYATKGRAAVLLAVCITITVGAMLVAEMREKAAAANCRDALAQIGLALENYQHETGSYPPLYSSDEHRGNRRHWRVLLLKYFDCDDYLRRINLAQAWDSKENTQVFETPPETVMRIYRMTSNEGVTNITSFLAIADDEDSKQPSEVVAGDRRRPTRIAVIQCCDKRIKWMEPRDLPIQDVRGGLETICRHRKYFSFLATDGQVGTVFSNRIEFFGDAKSLLKRWSDR